MRLLFQFILPLGVGVGAGSLRNIFGDTYNVYDCNDNNIIFVI